jgi:DNA-binding transcriptional MerR regulator
MKEILIGQLAAATSVPVATIRYYERRGLLATPDRTAGGYRSYDRVAIGRLSFIRRAKRVGFSLREISDLLEMRHRSTDVCRRARARASATIRRIDARIEELARMRDDLAYLAQACEPLSDAGDCPIIESLEEVDVSHG